MKKLVSGARSWLLTGALAAVALAALGVCHLACHTDDGPDVTPAGGSTFAPAGLVKSPLATPLSEGTREPEGHPADPYPVKLRELGTETGITFQHTDGSSGRRYVVETMSAGLATFDYDCDGLIDIYFPSGAWLPGAEFDKPPRHALYKNLGDWRFEDVAEQAGVASTAYGMGATVGDYDNDGWPDLYVLGFGPNILYHNNGDGTFTDVTEQAGVVGTTVGGVLAKKVGAGACFLDIEGDGLLDLYVGNYIELDLSTHQPRINYGIPSYPGPLDFPPVPDTLYRNNGDGTFRDVSKESGVGAHAGRSMGMTTADCDNDGDTDIFICNDVQENFLFRNDGRGHFEQVGLYAGVAMNFNAEMVANMGVDAGDYDNDGWLDFYTTNYQDTHPMLLRNLRDGMFEYVTWATNAGAGCYPYVNWGLGLVDFDNDGYKDVFVAQGHTEDNIELRDRTTAYRAPNVLLRNTGKGKFVDVSEECGLTAMTVHASRGAAFEDLDNDGDIDVAILNSRERPSILRNMLNEQGCKNHWLQIRLKGVKTNRGGVGAHVYVTAGDLSQLDEVHSGRAYQSHWGSRLHFGLGKHDRVDRIEVRWIGGGVDVLEDVAVDRLITITEGTGKPQTVDSRPPQS